MKFGRKKAPATENGDAVQNGNSLTVTANGNGHVRNTAELSIYEQYNQVLLMMNKMIINPIDNLHA